MAGVLCFQDQSESTHDGDLYDDVITSRDDANDEVCWCGHWARVSLNAAPAPNMIRSARLRMQQTTAASDLLVRIMLSFLARKWLCTSGHGGRTPLYI